MFLVHEQASIKCLAHKQAKFTATCLAHKHTGVLTRSALFMNMDLYIKSTRRWRASDEAELEVIFSGGLISVATREQILTACSRLVL